MGASEESDMSTGLLFWVIMIIGVLLYGFAWYNPDPRFAPFPNVVLWILLALLGWAVFGPEIHA
jgi:hypothetical protein